MCREVAYLRTLLQSKHRQLQELVNSHERAQTHQHQWEKVRTLHRERKRSNFKFITCTHIANDAMHICIFALYIFSYNFLL